MTSLIVTYINKFVLIIAGLSFSTDENSLREAFLPYGDVVEGAVISHFL